ncbi:MAG: hypothetical protein H6667_07620 [Ardenticatenaceae bacterium]|nr:hypothetical protein [Ardenticatenaceae bacterium]MCB9443880.1 hypothetical protein [Ardenticatenaceae bacterium]
MRRSILTITALLVFVVIVGTAITHNLAFTAPYRPGDALFGVQEVSEQLWGLGFNGDSMDRAQVQLGLMAHRMDDLTAVQGTPNEAAAVSALTRAHKRAVTAIAEAPTSEQSALQTRLDRISLQALDQLTSLSDAGSPTILALRDQIESSMSAMEVAVAATAVPSPQPTATAAATETAVFQGNQLDDPRLIPFPPEADILEAHSFFALTGGHANLLCSNCHSGETYQGTPANCAACHTDKDAHQGTYGTDCAACHTIDDWQNAAFDHSLIGAQDCADCHTAPENHYPGACRACHTDTTDFNVVFFDHAVVSGQDCAVCHAAPANHYPGACVNCHQDTGNFRNINFSHAGLTDCAACHIAPANHFPGQCSACHNTTTFAGATFNHTFPIYHGNANGDCTTCHPGNDTRTYTCYSCHNQQEMISEHSEEGIGDLSNCVRCHANGEEHDGEDGNGDEHEDGGEEHEDDD